MSFVPPSSRPFSKTDRPRPLEWVQVADVAPDQAQSNNGKSNLKPARRPRASNSVIVPVLIALAALIVLVALGYFFIKSRHG